MINIKNKWCKKLKNLVSPLQHPYCFNSPHHEWFHCKNTFVDSNSCTKHRTEHHQRWKQIPKRKQIFKKKFSTFYPLHLMFDNDTFVKWRNTLVNNRDYWTWLWWWQWQLSISWFRPGANKETLFLQHSSYSGFYCPFECPNTITC